jgi:YfiH family protein
MGYADGLVTGEPNTPLFMRFGDCTPLIFFDPQRHAVGLTHAGWRGTMKNAAGATVQAMVENLGCIPQNIMAVIGPSIGPCCYEVGRDVVTAAEKAFNPSSGLFIRRNGRTGRAHFDMWAANQRQLTAAGVKQIIQSNLCTACRTDEFFSHRAEKGNTGRFGVIIGLKGAAP